MELFAGLDVHSQFTVGTVVDVKGHIVHEGKVPTTSDGYRTFFEPIRFQNQIKAVFEASRNWSYIAGLLRAQNVETVMAHPLKVRSIACAKIKTDKIDSQKLAHLLRADMIPMSYMPSQDIVQLRELVRYRVRLGKMRSQLKTQIRTVLAREGKTCPFTDVSGSKASIFLKKQGLLPQNQRELNYLLSLLTNMTEEIDSLQKGIHEEAIKHPEVQLITSIPGFADYSGLLILSEIGDINRFDSPEKLAAYAGLVSSTHQSSDTCRQGKITKQGSRWLRWILVECTTITIRKPNRLQRFYTRLKAKKGHNKAIVATAHKTLMIIWHLLRKQQVFQP